MSVLRLTQLSVSYQKNPVIKQLDLQVIKGEIVGLFGPSGGGKSTILKAIAGLLDEVGGEIEIDDVVVFNKRVNVPAEKRHTGLIFQDYALFPHMTVMENISFGLHKMKKAERINKVMEMLELIKLSDYKNSYPHQLSGGQQQRIAIVRALACEPKILLFDEAFSNIDPKARFELIADIRALLKQQQISALFVTHNQDEAFSFCDRIAVLNQGRIEQIDTPEVLFSVPETEFVAEFLGPGVWLEAQVVSNNQLMSELGFINYTGSQPLFNIVGKDVQVYLRPHQLRLELAPDSQYLVDKERFSGEQYESEVNYAGRKVKVKSYYSFINKSVKIKIDSNINKVFY